MKAIVVCLIAASGLATTIVHGDEHGIAGYEHRTRHLSFEVLVVPDVLVAGVTMSLVVNIAPNPGMHVYAPGTDHRAVSVSLSDQAMFQMRDIVYPKAVPYVFKPLNETSLVYAKPFRIVRSFVATAASMESKPRITLRGIIEYQACDATVCYLPASVPFEHSVAVRRVR